MSDQQRYRQVFTAANIVTIMRIVLIPVFVFLILEPWPAWLGDPTWAIWFKPWVAAGVFALLAVTDGVDGYLARSRNEITTLGKFLDPLADKILVTAALLALVELGTLPAWIALVIISREFLVSGLRMVASAEGQVIAASWFGKIKTVTQIIAVLLFIIKDSPTIIEMGDSAAHSANIVAWIVMAVALVLTLLSLADYFLKSSTVLGMPLNGKKSD